MVRPFFLVIFAFPLFVLAQPKISGLSTQGSRLNLSVEFPDPGISRLPSRAERLHALEFLGQDVKPESLDELAQDLLYLSKWKEGLLKKKNEIPSFHDARPQKAQSSQLKKAIIFFDMNFSPAEIKAAKEAAKARGEEFILFPERTESQQREIEKHDRRQIGLWAELQKCQQQSTQSCLPIENQIKDVRHKLEQVLRQIPSINDLNAIFAKIEAKQLNPSVLILSGHSAGGLMFSGVFGRLLADDVTKALVQRPHLTKYLSSVLLWGCYTGTLSSLTEVWQRKLPPGIAFIGYRNRSPLGIRPSSGRLLKSYLFKEQVFLAAQETQEAHQVFRSLDLVADLDATAVRGNIFFAYDRAAPVSELLAKCDQFDPKLMEQYICFWEGQPGCENPPANHLGPLRQLYSYLQINRHCQDILRSKHPKLPTPEQLVRLIYIDNIKANFARHHSHEFKSYNDYLSELNISSQGRVESYIGSTRSMDLQRFHLVEGAINKLGFRDGSFINRSNWQSIFKFSDANRGLKFVIEGDQSARWLEPCTPFSWIELGSKELDSCGFGFFLGRPLSSLAELRLIKSYYNNLFYFWSKELYHSVSLLGVNNINRDSIKNGVLGLLLAETERLEQLADRSEMENHWLNHYRQVHAQIESLPVEQVIQWLLKDLELIQLKFDELIKQAQQDPHGPEVSEDLIVYKAISKGRISQLRELLGEDLY